MSGISWGYKLEGWTTMQKLLQEASKCIDDICNSRIIAITTKYGIVWLQSCSVSDIKRHVLAHFLSLCSAFTLTLFNTCHFWRLFTLAFAVCSAATNVTSKMLYFTLVHRFVDYFNNVLLCFCLSSFSHSLEGWTTHKLFTSHHYLFLWYLS